MLLCHLYSLSNGIVIYLVTKTSKINCLLISIVGDWNFMAGVPAESISGPIPTNDNRQGFSFQFSWCSRLLDKWQKWYRLPLILFKKKGCYFLSLTNLYMKKRYPRDPFTNTKEKLWFPIFHPKEKKKKKKALIIRWRLKNNDIRFH